nr:immunoglobulin light chain junction region [Macaca mulatta]MOX77989.1 immunoglobulin light chain junction region [Macaca mulatta]MOX81511.1 immunoglobulin light chain junction region [Macaca mulatta]
DNYCQLWDRGSDHWVF